MRSLFYFFFKLSSKLHRMRAHIRGYYFSRIFKSCGAVRPLIQRNVILSSPKDIECGSGVRINPQCYIIAKGGVTLGDNVILSVGAKILTSSLNIEDGIIQKRHIHKPVKLGDRVWIGSGAIICPGVTIGENTIIGAGSVVTRDIPGNCIAAGVPAKVIRSIEVEKI